MVILPQTVSARAFANTLASAFAAAMTSSAILASRAAAEPLEIASVELMPAFSAVTIQASASSLAAFSLPKTFLAIQTSACSIPAPPFDTA